MEAMSLLLTMDGSLISTASHLKSILQNQARQSFQISLLTNKLDFFSRKYTFVRLICFGLIE